MVAALASGAAGSPRAAPRPAARPASARPRGRRARAPRAQAQAGQQHAARAPARRRARRACRSSARGCAPAPASVSAEARPARAAPHVLDLRSGVVPGLRAELPRRGRAGRPPRSRGRTPRRSRPAARTARGARAAQAPVSQSTRHGLVVRELAAVEAVEDARARRELAQVEVLGREPEDGREAPARALQAPVGPQQARADGAGRGPRLGEAHELVDRARAGRRRRCSGAAASARSRARAPRLLPAPKPTFSGSATSAHVGVLGRQPGRGAVLRGLVDDDHLARRRATGVGRQRGQAAREQRAALVAHDHDRDVRHGAARRTRSTASAEAATMIRTRP